MPKNNLTKTTVAISAVSTKQIAGITGLLLGASAAIAFILTFFLVVR
ncbi:MAG: hypothetical protein WC517_02185 [Patescibacteria group bacterium]